MKPKEIFYLLGLKPGLKTYGIEVVDLDLPTDGKVRMARWLHPVEKNRQTTQAEIDALRAFLRPGDVAIDIGAHSGDTALPMGLAVGPTGAVLAFEPNRHIFPVLATNAVLNPEKTDIRPLMFAATPEDGEIEFEYSDASFHNGGRHETIDRWRHAHAFNLKVEGRNLERYLRAEQADLLPRLRYIKTDAEGFDYSILKSLEGVLREFRPYIRAEVYRHTPPERRAELFDYLQGLGYEIRYFGGDAGYAGERLTSADVARWRHFDIFCIPGAAAG